MRSAARSSRRRRERRSAGDGLEAELRGVEAPAAIDPARSRNTTVTRCPRERLDVDAETSRSLGRGEQLTGRSSVCVEVRTQPRCKDAQLLVGEIREHRTGERAEHAGSGLIEGRRRLAGGHDERVWMKQERVPRGKRRGVQKRASRA